MNTAPAVKAPAKAAGGSGSGSEEASGANLAPNETFDAVRGGARLILNYDTASNAFQGTVENTTSNVLGQVRIEVHLSNGTELGPTTPIDLAPGETGVGEPAVDGGVLHRLDCPRRGGHRSRGRRGRRRKRPRRARGSGERRRK